MRRIESHGNVFLFSAADERVNFWAIGSLQTNLNKQQRFTFCNE